MSFIEKSLPPLSSHAAAIAPFIAMDVMREARNLATLRAAANQPGIISLAVGEPGAASPRLVREAAMRVLDSGRVPYTEALGLPALRNAISRYYRTRYAADVPASRIVVTTGSSGGFVLAFLAVMEHGGRIGIPEPGYPAYRNILTALGIEAVEIPTTAQSQYALDAEAIAATHAKTPLNGVLIMSPANPTGVLTSESAIAALVQTCAKLGLWLVSDEIYHGLVHEGREATALQFSDEAVIVNSFSKYFCMTGWRIGWLVVPERLVRPLECLAQNLAISAPYLSQMAAIAAFDATEELEAIKAGYAQNRAILQEALPNIGLPPLPMDGAFYAYCDITRHSNDAMAFCKRALVEAGVALTPGLDFDRTNGNRFLRLSYAGSAADIREGLARLKTWLG